MREPLDRSWGSLTLKVRKITRCPSAHIQPFAPSERALT